MSKQNIPTRGGNYLINIRQMSLFSFEDIIDFQHESKLDMIIINQIDVSSLTSALRKSSDSRGPKGFDSTNMFYTLIAMQVLRINRISELVSQLKENPVLRYNCGFKVIGKVPSESTFSRFINKISESSVLEDLFSKLVIKTAELGFVDGEHISIDSTKLNSYEASKPWKQIIDDGSNPNWGMKRDTNGNNIR